MFSKLRILRLAMFALVLSSSGWADTPPPPTFEPGLTGSYRAILSHEGTKFYQNALITIRQSDIGKYAANVRVFFGGEDSAEYLVYDFNDITFKPSPAFIALQADKSDVALQGTHDGKVSTISGHWYSKLVGRVGTFVAKKGEAPKAPEDGIPVRTLGGYYRGTLVNTHPESSLPERVTLNLVTTQDITTAEPTVKIDGNVRFYVGPFGSAEYLETKLSSTQFNFYSRRFTASGDGPQGPKYTLVGTMSKEGVFSGAVHVDGLGAAAKVEFKPAQ